MTPPASWWMDNWSKSMARMALSAFWDKEPFIMSTFIGIILGMFGISVMQLILATAMPFIVTEIGGDYLYSWVFSSYMLASLLTIPVFSKLADLYGKKKFYLLGMGIFAIGTLYGGLAADMEHLIVARVIQGLGAGMMIPVSLAMISELFSAEKRGNMIGIFGFVQLLAILLSPLLGSFITKQLGWHWIFYITFGVILAAMLLVTRSKETRQSSQPVRWSGIDLLGGLLFGVFCVLVVSFSNIVSQQGKIELSGVFLLLGAVISAILLVWNETHHKDPVIKVSFFRTKILRRSIISSVIAGGIMYGVVTLFPLCGVSLNNQGYNINENRTLMLFLIGVTIGMLISSRLMTKLNNTAFPRLLWALSLIGAGLIYYSIKVGNLVMFNFVTGILGFSLGGIMATLLINSQNAVSSEDRTVLSGLVQLGRYLGAAIGVTVLTGILPEVSQITTAAQFLGAFGLLVGMYVLGLVNELI
jgi:MFS family permease